MMLRRRHKTHAENFPAHTKKQTHYLSMQSILSSCMDFKKPLCLSLKIIERDYWYRFVFVDLLYILHATIQVCSQNTEPELKSEDIFGELLRTRDESSVYPKQGTSR